MAVPNRSALFARTQRVLKKHYEPIKPDIDRTLLEQLVFACCLENTAHETASLIYDRLVHQFFDWNEIRVSTVRELAEVMKPLSDPEDSARRLRAVLQSVFESIYTFDLEALRKQNIGQAVQKLDQYKGTTKFSLSYLTQTALGGHSIPLNCGAMEALEVIGAITADEAKKGIVPGLERAIPKNKAIAFGSQLHQLGVEFYRNPFGPTARKILMEIAPGCKDRLPKRAPKKLVQPQQKVPTTKKTKKKASAPKSAGTKKKASAKKSTAGKASKAYAKSKSKKSTPSQRLSQGKPR